MNRSGPVAVMLVSMLSACLPESAGEVLTTRQDPQENALFQKQLMEQLGCPSLAEEEDLCLRSGYPGTLTLFSPATLQSCPVPAFPPPHASALAWIGGSIYVCDMGERSVTRISLTTGRTETRPVPDDLLFCSAAAAWRGKLVLLTGAGIVEVASFDELQTRRTLVRGPFTASRMAVHGDVAYLAWHSTDTIERVNLATGQTLPLLDLGFDDWIFGMGALRDGRLAVVRPTRVAAGLQFLDGTTGALLSEGPATGFNEGTQALSCGGARWPVEGAAPPPSDPVSFSGTCGSGGPGAEGVDLGGSARPEVHVVSIYEPSAGDGGPVQVTITRPGRVVLVLAAYDATAWKVSVGPLTTVERIIVSGYHTQRLDAPAGIPGEIRSYDDGRSANVLPFSATWNSFEARQLQEKLEKELSVPLRSYSGCYSGGSFEIR